MQDTKNRLIFIDGLRGLAAMAVAGFHFYNGGPLREPLSKILYFPLSIVLKYGWLGVEVFFVISGFVIAYSFRKEKITKAFLKAFTIRRFLRLGIPYWVTIAITIAIKYASNFILNDRLESIPSLGVIIAHIFYLQNILGMGDIIPVFWTLCLEMQFYLIFPILLIFSKFFSQKIPPKFQLSIYSLIFVPLALFSLLFGELFETSLHPTLIPYWYMFSLGIFTYWISQEKLDSKWFWIYIALILGKSLLQSDIRGIVVVITSVSIYIAVKSGQIYNWLDFKWCQYLGKISYSFYLVHTLIGMRVINIGYRVSGKSEIFAIFWFFLAFVFAIATAHIIYELFEKPSIELSKKFQIKAVSQ